MVKGTMTDSEFQTVMLWAWQALEYAIKYDFNFTYMGTLQIPYAITKYLEDIISKAVKLGVPISISTQLNSPESLISDANAMYPSLQVPPFNLSQCDYGGKRDRRMDLAKRFHCDQYINTFYEEYWKLMKEEFPPSGMTNLEPRMLRDLLWVTYKTITLDY